MTSKEFYRRIEAYIPLNQAASIFFVCSDVHHIYRRVICWSDSKSVSYVREPSTADFELSRLASCISLYFEKFTKNDFDIQFKYFKSFYSRCSLYQKEVLRSSYVLNTLVSLL